LEELALSMQCSPEFKAINSGGVDEDLWGVIVVSSSCGGKQFAIKVIMVIMTSCGRPMGNACGHSTG